MLRLFLLCLCDSASIEHGNLNLEVRRKKENTEKHYDEYSIVM